jgi:hypothetical protein
MNRRALGLPVSPPWPWDDNNTSKYNLVEIAIEFIMWDATGVLPRFYGHLT